MSLSPEALYQQLGSLIAEMPDLTQGPITPEINRWLGRATALVELTGDKANWITLKVAAQNITGPIRIQNAQAIATIVHEALAKAELLAPAGAQGAFIPVGHKFDAFAAVAKVLAEARKDLLFVDPYSDEKVLTDYALSAPERVNIRLLADKADHKKSLKPAAEHWVKQFVDARPLTVRLAASKTLHDRLIIVDGIQVWGLGQSFNKLVERAHTSLVRMPAESAALKIAAYESMWDMATPLP